MGLYVCKHLISFFVGWFDWMFPTLFLWLMNGMIAVGVLAKILIFGEPVVCEDSEASVVFWRHRKQADVDLAKVCRNCYLNN